MKTLKYLSTLLKEVYKSRGDTAMSYLKNEKGTVTYTNGNYLIKAPFEEAKQLPELFLVEQKRAHNTYHNETLVNGFKITSPKDIPVSDYPPTDRLENDALKLVPTITININAEYLKNIAEVISKNGSSVSLHITNDMSMIRVEGDKENTFAILMPLKPNWRD